MIQPLIGITTAKYTDHRGLPYFRGYAPIAQAVIRAGGLPVFIPSGIDETTLRAIYERVDGVLIPGGPDVDPVHYDEAAHPTVVIDYERDAVELPLARWSVADDVPLFGICRGHQVINVALGGSLIQDIPSHIPTDIRHDTEAGEPRDEPRHTVNIDGSSALASVMGLTLLHVNSLHHQAVKQAAPSARVTAISEDGIIEGIEFPGKRFALSVQWHPEDMYESDPTMLRLFEAFVSAARERAQAKA